jgi:Na+-transporting methylmalonyl-CoA/oxaloacetate decarboxylase gamma subunit
MGFALKTSRGVVALLLLGLLLALVGCGSDASSQDAQREARQQATREAHREAERRRLRRIVARERHEEARRRARAHAALVGAREKARVQEEAEVEEEAETSECDPNYSGACLDPYASDYDCEGGSGNGPEYTGPVAVVGSDHYGLDADGDGYGCE